MSVFSHVRQAHPSKVGQTFIHMAPEPVVSQSTYVPVFFYDLWAGPMLFQGKHIGTCRLNSACPHFARVNLCPGSCAVCSHGQSRP